VAILVALAIASSALAATPARVCRQACGELIAGCIADGGRPRKCRRQTIRLCRRQGPSACFVTAPTTTLPPVTVTTTSSTTTTTTQPAGLAGLFGTWEFTYSIISTFTDRYVMSFIQTSPDGVPFIPVYDVYDGRTDAIAARTADLGVSSVPYEFALLDASTYFCDFFVFDKTGPNSLGGEYFLTDVDFDGSCGDIVGTTTHPMTGARLRAAIAADSTGDGAPIDLRGLVRALGAVGQP
jgi:hypothetical protein